MPAYDSILADAMQLPISSRLELIEAIRRSIPDDSSSLLSVEWMAEIQRRSAEYDSGAVATIPLEEVRSELIKRFAGSDG